jgi:hypothetical protein
MMKTPPTKLLCGLALFVGTCCLLTGCPGGGGGTGDTLGSGVIATFSGPTPTANSVSLQAGSSAGSAFQVVVRVRDVNDFFSSTFRISFDPTSASYISSDSSGSFLHNSTLSTDFDTSLVSAGLLQVDASVVGSGGGAGVNITPATATSGSITIQPGTISGDSFELLITATDISDFFGAAFHLTFDTGSATYDSFDASGSFLEGGGISTQYDVVESTPGDLAVAATRLQNGSGTVAGVDVSGSQTLLALTFTASALTSGNDFNMDTPREVEQCTGTPGACSMFSATWTGGTMTNLAEGGVDVAGTQDLIILNFNATAATGGNPFTFTVPMEVCDSTAQPSCNAIPVSFLSGSALVAN